MIIYGSRMYFKKNVVKTFGECEHCGTYGQQMSYKAKKYGHIYFIPLIPLGAHSQVLRECKTCDMGMHIPTNDLEPRIDSLSDQFKDWIMEIQSGNTMVAPEPSLPPENVGVMIAGILEDLYCLKEIENVDHISKILTDNNLRYENDLVLGRWWEMQGDLNKAKASYESAHRAKPSDPIALYQMGCADVKLRNAAGAEATFQKYCQLCPEDVNPWVELASLYETMRDHANIVRTYDMIYAMNPDVIPDRNMKKIYKKACKKSGQQGKFLNQM